MKKIIISLIAIIGIAAVFGCARYQRIEVLQTDHETPYNLIGTLEVEATAHMVPDPYIIGLELITLGEYRSQDTPTRFRNILNRKLAARAHGVYGADAVVNVQYWPDPSSKEFPDGKIYARGDMIQYRPFAQKSAS